MKNRVFSGMRPTGKLHLGNYLGALVNWVELQKEYECIYSIVDLHALTTDYADTKDIKNNVLEVAIDWLSCGLNPEKSILFVQSHIPEHAELHLILSMIVPISWLERNPTYKEQIKELKDKELSNYGFLGYPVLQAADILLYKANYIPVGEDQLPHIELCREIARRFNYLYGEVFPVPEAKLTKSPKILGTDGRKMSKSYNNCIYISDSPEEIKGKILKMFTDPQRKRRHDPGNPDICPVFMLHRVFTEENLVKEILESCRIAKIGCVDCKNILIKSLINALEPIYRKRRELSPKDVIDILNNGAERGRKIAKNIFEEVKDVVGISFKI
jgi:tryptophanyl-tRNA synthetase